MHNSRLICELPVVEHQGGGHIAGVGYYLRSLICQRLEIGGIFFFRTHIALN